MQLTRSSSVFSQFILTILLALQLTLAADPTSQTIYLGYTLPPYSSQHPQPLAQITYTLSASGTRSATVDTWTPPPAAASNGVQIGVLKAGSGSGFASNKIFVSKDLVLDQHAVVQLNLDSRTGQVWSVGVVKQAGLARTVADVPEAVVAVEARAPVPAVNKPVVLSAEGKVQEAPPEKTLFQKYWWVLLGVTFVMMSGAGGGGDGK